MSELELTRNLSPHPPSSARTGAMQEPRTPSDSRRSLQGASVSPPRGDGGGGRPAGRLPSGLLASVVTGRLPLSGHPSHAGPGQSSAMSGMMPLVAGERAAQRRANGGCPKSKSGDQGGKVDI
jgi:hypothetical protein